MIPIANVVNFLQKQQQQAAANAEGGGQRKKKVTAAQLRVQKGEAFAPESAGETMNDSVLT